MQTSSGRASRVLAPFLVLGVALSLSLGLSSAAQARKPVRPSVPTDLTIGTVTYVGGSYRVPLTWKAGANTTSFSGTVTGGGTTLATASLTGTTWTPTITAKAGTTVTAQIVGVNGKFKSAAATASVKLPDVTAPTGSYQATWGDPDAGTGQVTVTFKQVALSDDVSPNAEIQVAVDFGNGTTKPTNGSETTFTQPYDFPTSGAKRYQPTIRLTDATGNSAYAAVNAIVLNDHTAPTGTAKVGTAAGWARWTKVSLTTTATDDLSPAAKVKRTIAWGDGTTTTTYGDRTLQHVYAAAGTFRPTVTLADEALTPNTSAAVVTGSAVIKRDVYGPTTTLTLPHSKRKSVRSWKVLRGTAKDGQTAVRSVRVKAVEKRGRAYYAYVPAKRAWVKAGRKARAFSTAGYVQVTTAGAWRVSLPKLAKGTLVYRVQATDVMGNVSAVVQHQQKLTKR